MRSLLDVPCAHCGATTGASCRSVGDNVIVTGPHMARLKAAGAYVGSGLPAEQYDALQREYERSSMAALFDVPYEQIPPHIVARAKRERSINPTKSWVQRAIAALHGEQQLPVDNVQGALL